MNRLKLNYWVDMGMGLSVIVTFLTGIVKWPGLINIIGLSNKEIPKAAISAMHDWAGLLMGLFVLVHLILHWKWITCVTKKTFRKEKKECETT